MNGRPVRGRTVAARGVALFEARRDVTVTDDASSSSYSPPPLLRARQAEKEAEASKAKQELERLKGNIVTFSMAVSDRDSDDQGGGAGGAANARYKKRARETWCPGAHGTLRPPALAGLNALDEARPRFASIRIGPPPLTSRAPHLRHALARRRSTAIAPPSAVVLWCVTTRTRRRH